MISLCDYRYLDATVCSGDNSTLKIKLDNEGSISKNCEDINYGGISSIAYNDELILYNYRYDNVYCNYYSTYNESNSLEECRNFNKTDDNNLCCFLNETIVDNNTFFTTIGSCIEVNKYEIERFKGTTIEKFNKFISEGTPNKFYLSCDSSLYKINKIIFYLLFLYLYF